MGSQTNPAKDCYQYQVLESGMVRLYCNRCGIAVCWTAQPRFLRIVEDVHIRVRHRFPRKPSKVSEAWRNQGREKAG